MFGLSLTKSLIGLEDLLLGEHKQLQYRGGESLAITPINLIQPVRNVEELKMLNPKKFGVCFLLSDDVQVQGELKFDNEFYVYDFLAEGDEDFPHIVKSSVTDVGRWKLCSVGQNRITAQIVKEVNEKTKNVENNVIFRVTPRIEQLVEEEVQQEVAILRKQGGVYHIQKDFSYDKNNFIQSFTHKEGDIFGRIFLVKDTQDKPLTTAPIIGDIYSKGGGVKIYEENENLRQDDKFVEVFAKHIRKSPVLRVKDNVSYRLYTDDMIPSGTLGVKCFSNGTTTLSFDIVFAGMSYKDFSFANVIYSPLVKTSQMTSQYGMPFFPKFAIISNSVYTGLAIEDTQFCDSIQFDFTNINTKPLFQEDRFSNLGSYAIRNGGGTYIKEIGNIIRNYKQPIDTKYCSFDFYQFSNGFLYYNKSIALDTDIYHHYKDMGCVEALIDISNMHFISSGQSTPAVGSVQQPALPNVKWKGNLTSTRDYLVDVNRVEERMWMAGINKDGFVRLNKRLENVISPYDFNAKRDCSSIYQDGETTVKTLSMFVSNFIVCY